MEQTVREAIHTLWGESKAVLVEDVKLSDPMTSTYCARVFVGLSMVYPWHVYRVIVDEASPYRAPFVTLDSTWKMSRQAETRMLGLEHPPSDNNDAFRA